MKVKEMRNLSAEELQTKVAEARLEIVQLRFQLSTHKLANLGEYRKARRRLAQLLTIQSETSRTVANSPKR